jgi:hypothetical protein
MGSQEPISALERDLRAIFGERLRSIVVYGLRSGGDHHSAHHASHASAHHSPRSAMHSLALVDRLSTDDLRACAGYVDRWEDQGLAAPLILGAEEFGRSLDVFPFEFGAILNDYSVASGGDPFEGLRVDPSDLRRACEVQARGHLLHLREGYLEARGHGGALALLIEESAPAFATLVSNVARLDGAEARDARAAARHVERQFGGETNVPSRIVALAIAGEVASEDADQLFSAYLDIVERLVGYIDRWR